MIYLLLVSISYQKSSVLIEQFKNPDLLHKIAIVTGASAGIDAAIIEDLAKAGFTFIGLVRRVERVEALKAEISGVSGNSCKKM